MTSRRLQRDRPALRRSVALACSVLLAGCTGDGPPTPSFAATGTERSTPSGSATVSPTATATPSAVSTASAFAPRAWDGRIVIHLSDGSFRAADRNALTPLALPPGTWSLGSGASRDTILLLPDEPATLDAALGRAGDDSVSLVGSLGSGDSLAGGGCLSPGGAVALADAETLALALVDASGRVPIAFAGHATVGECAWLDEDALAAPAEHDHALLYFHRTGREHAADVHEGAFAGVAGRYPSTAAGALSLTTGNAHDEAITVMRVGRVTGDGSVPPVLEPALTVRPGDGPRRGTHALSPDGRWLAVAALERGVPFLLILEVADEGRERGRFRLPLPAAGLAFLER